VRPRQKGVYLKKRGKEEEKKEKKNWHGSWILTNKQFSELPILELTPDAIKEINYTHLTQVLKF
jgi:ATP-dependent RNA helicase DDX18/HAS1